MGDNGERDAVRELHERNRPTETTPVAVRLPKPLLDDIDELWETAGFETRSAFVRAVLAYVADRQRGTDFLDGERSRVERLLDDR